MMATLTYRIMLPYSDLEVNMEINIAANRHAARLLSALTPLRVVATLVEWAVTTGGAGAEQAA